MAEEAQDEEMPDDHPPSTLVGSDAWFRQAVERMGDFVCAIDREGTVVYANPATQTWLGLLPNQLIGRNCLEMVHPDDLERAIATIEYGSGSRREYEVPVAFRLRQPEGWATFEVRGHGLETDPNGETMLLCAREGNNSELLDDLLDSMGAAEEFPRVVELIAHQCVRRLWQNEAAVLYRDGDQTGVAHTGLSPQILELLESDIASPWREAMETGEDVIVNEVGSLDKRLASALRAAGFSTIFAFRLDEVISQEQVCVVVCGPRWFDPHLGFGVALERVKKLLRVAIQQRYHLELLERSARTDPLTGLANRRRFFHRLEAGLAEWSGDGEEQLGVLFLDLDHFKPVNDQYGHATGDRVLREVGARLAGLVGEHSLAARLGGDEFAVVCVGESAAALDETARDAIARPIEVDGVTLAITASIGTTDAQPDDTAEVILERADRASYDDKARRR